MLRLFHKLARIAADARQSSALPTDLIRRGRAQIRYADVEDPGVLRDIDTPFDYDALLAAPC